MRMTHFRLLIALRRKHRRAFSLVEVLLAIFILGIGMIMVASVFPVGANWTRQTAETSNGQNIAQNALTVIQRHYGPGGDLHPYFNPDYLVESGGVLIPNNNNVNSVLKAGPTITPFTLQALPGFIPNAVNGTIGISPAERGYLFGNSNPFPVPAGSFNACTYFWTALVRLNPSHQSPLTITNPTVAAKTNFIQPAASYNYDVYILVFRKGAVEHKFTNAPMPAGYTFNQIPGLRDLSDSTFDESLIPSVGYTSWSKGTYDANRTPSVYDALPGMGQFGIGATSGTVFRQVLNSASNPPGATPRPAIISNPIEPIIYSPPADGTDRAASPLIYIYQTTLSF